MNQKRAKFKKLPENPHKQRLISSCFPGSDPRGLSKGFTLIELLVVVSIVALIAAMVLIDYRQGERELNINSEAEGLASILRTAQADALSGTLVNSIRPNQYGIIFSFGGYDYTFFAETDNNCLYSGPDANNFLIQNFDLIQGISVEKIQKYDSSQQKFIDNFSSSIIFAAPKSDIYYYDAGINGCKLLTGNDFIRIILFQSASGRHAYIDLYSQGKIEITK
ncbi:MAG: hypothetical protein BWY03_00269 [Parcubacteria group bacterium ADurb.Bin159]|jgi:prepilin-type N-terminal cleavage/methylation domain-containing protein|nr:MAG: hypothetical protein BWY03_00269 [Parcubacteria group bacterium ADurb.Bin159]